MALKALISILFFVAIVLGVEYFIVDINSLLTNLTVKYSPEIVFSTFLISETILGLLPPEVFIAWASKSTAPWMFLFILASLSYLGGILAYIIGKRVALLPAVKNYLEIKIKKHLTNLRKWGGLFVFIGATLPIPHSLVSMASGIINFNFNHYLLWALFRFLRFVLYALVIFQIF
jgi:membrane protein YqaA with SNARE-associated domain